MPRDIERCPRVGLLAAYLGILAASGPSVAVAAPADYIGKPLVSVRLQLDGEDVQDEDLVELVETRVGDPLVMSEVRESILHLISLGRYQDVQVDASLVPAGVALVYRLIPLSNVERLVFRGDLGLPEPVVRAEVVERYGPAPPAGRASEVADTLLALYRSRGYIKASVAPFPGALGSQVLIFDIAAGPRARIGTIDVQGRSLVSERQLLGRVGVSVGDTYDPVDLERRIDLYVEELWAEGRYEASVEHEVRLHEDQATVDFTLLVEPGRLVTVAFEGDPLPPGQEEALVPIREEGAVDEDLLEDSSRRIAQFLHALGYWRAMVAYRRDGLEDELVVTFDIRRGAQYLVERIEMVGQEAIAEAELRALLTLTPDGPFVEASLQVDVGSIAELYRRRGFADVAVTAEVPGAGGQPTGELPPRGGTAYMTPRIVIDEGLQFLVEMVEFAGHAAVAEPELREGLRSRQGQPYFRPLVLADQDAVLVEYLNRGFREAAVDVEVRRAADRARVDIVFAIREGPQVLVDHIIVVGNTRTDRGLIERELLLEPGRPLGLGDVIESQRRLRALGLFRSVTIGELVHGDRGRRDVLVTVEEAQATSLGYGGGLEAGLRLHRSAEGDGQAEERLEFAPRGFFEIGRRNLWGKNRSLDLFTRVSVRPNDTADDPEKDGGGLGFNEYRVIGTYQEPRVFGWSGDGIVTGVLEQAIRSSFSFIRRGVDAELVQGLSGDVRMSVRYNLSRTRLFDEKINPEDQLLVDRLFPQVRLSRFSGGLLRDTRPDPLDPDRGTLLGVDAQLAARAIGSEVGFARTLLQSFVYRRLPGPRRVILALGARLGLAVGFPRDVVRTDEDGNPIVDEDGEPIVDVVDELPASERFFAGGDTTVRGFALDRLGDEATIDQDGFPKGGQGLIVLNAEVRVPVWGGVGAVGFLDAGNVYATASEVELANIRGTAGFGVRYQSPIGPIRVDLGFKLDRRRFENGEEERLTALHISIGQAF